MSIKNKWIAYRRKWLKENPPNHQGYYECGLCGGMVEQAEVTLDHKEPRSRRPDLRFDKDNIQPAHFECNSKKGSK